MKPIRGQPAAGSGPRRARRPSPSLPSGTQAQARELVELRARLGEADETLRAIRAGEVDAVVITRNRAPQVYTLEGAGDAYRVLIESMNEGALTLTSDKTILYANQCFARMVKTPLEQVIGSSFRRFLSAADRSALRLLFQRPNRAGAKIQVTLTAGDGSHLPAQVSVRPFAKDGFNRTTMGMVVTDVTEARRTEELLRALNNRVVQVQESERERVALELHDHITQLLCAILFRSQALVDELSASGGPSMKEAVSLREMLSTTAGEVERISRDLRPGVLDQLGLVAVLRATCMAFEERTGVSVTQTGVDLATRLPANTELALYRILQEALKNVTKHASARHVTVSLARHGDQVQLTIKDDGIGFDPVYHPGKRKGKNGLGLLGMRERAAYVGGTFKVKSARRAGTEIEVSIPLAVTASVSN